MGDRDLYQHAYRAPDPGAPLILAFHGTGGDETQFLDLIPQIVPGAGIVAPRGDVSEQGMARFFRRTGEGIYDMTDLARATHRMGSFVAAHRAAHDGHAVWAMGYSNGANILASVMFDRPDLVDRAALLHPLIPWTPRAQPGLAGKPVLMTAGKNDPICPWQMTQSLQAWFVTQGVDASLTAHEGGHELRPEELGAVQDLFRNQAQKG